MQLCGGILSRMKRRSRKRPLGSDAGVWRMVDASKRTTSRSTLRQSQSVPRDGSSSLVCLQKRVRVCASSVGKSQTRPLMVQ